MRTQIKACQDEVKASWEKMEAYQGKLDAKVEANQKKMEVS
jgi:hypothetical protein